MKRRGSRPEQAVPATRGPGTARSAAGSRRAAARGPMSPWAAGGLLLFAGMGAFLALRDRGGAGPVYPIGGASLCKRPPAFAAAQGFSAQAQLSTQDSRRLGLVITEGGADDGVARVYQHPSWSLGGHLGPPVLDGSGNVYVIPVPYVHVLDNPAEKQNIIYRVDGQTGKMRPLVDLPVVAPPSAANPYGLVGLTYDCDLQSLYASSLSGSDETRTLGRLYQVDPASGKVRDMMEGIDAFGLSTFNGAKGKRLYFGLARRSAVVSLALNADGGFADQAPRSEFSLAGLGVHGDEKARRITVGPDQAMVVRIMTFDFNLVSNSERLQTGLRYTYDGAIDRWSYADRFPID